jgi:hypothetical protein
MLRTLIEKFASFDGETPSHPIIWEGKLESLDAIAKNNRSIAFPASTFDDPQPSPPPAATSLPVPAIAQNDSGRDNPRHYFSLPSYRFFVVPLNILSQIQFLQQEHQLNDPNLRMELFTTIFNIRTGTGDLDVLSFCSVFCRSSPAFPRVVGGTQVQG